MGKPRKGTAWMVEAWATCQAGSGDSGDKTDEGASGALSDGQSPEHGVLAGWSAYVSAAAAAAAAGQLYAEGSFHTPPSSRRSVLLLVPFCR